MSRRANKPALDAGMMPQAPKDRVETKDAGPRGLSRGLGNAATATLLQGKAKAIPPSLRARMEQSFGVDLKGLRVDDSSPARQEADSLNAEALVRDGQIRWSSSAPAVDSPAAAPLLAHEIAHVVQHSRASSIEDRVSSPGESSEMSAQAAADQALGGQAASVGAGGAVAGTQRQPKPKSGKEVDSEVALEMVTMFLRKVANTTPPQNIKKAKVVRDALMKLAFSSGPAAGLIDVNKFIDDPMTSSDPATMAKQFVAKVPRISAAALQSLEKASTIDPQASTLTRVGDLVTGSAAGKGPERPAEPGYVSPADKADQMKDTLSAMRGTTAPTTYGPGDVDVLQLARIAGGLKSTLKPQATKAAPPKSEDYPAVTAAIAKMPKDALIPAEAKGKGDPGEWASTAEFSADVARRMDVAQKSGQTEITVDLGANYEGVKNREALRDAVEAIIQQLRNALPHHASDVRYVIVKTGKVTLTRGMAEAK